jgi:hypothetical protein
MKLELSIIHAIAIPIAKVNSVHAIQQEHKFVLKILAAKLVFK